MRALAVIFHQPALCDFTRFIQGSEHIKIQYFFPVRPVELFNKAFCVGLPGMMISSITPCSSAHCASVSDTSSAPSYRITTICHYPVRHSHDPLRRDIQVNFCSQRFTVKIIHRIEGPQASATHQRIMHKIDGPALVNCFRRRQWSRISHRQTLLSLTVKIQFKQAVNPVNAVMVPPVVLTSQHLEQLLKAVSRIALRQFSHRQDHRLISTGIGLVIIDFPAHR